MPKYVEAVKSLLSKHPYNPITKKDQSITKTSLTQNPRLMQYAEVVANGSSQQSQQQKNNRKQGSTSQIKEEAEVEEVEAETGQSPRKWEIPKQWQKGRRKEGIQTEGRCE